MAANDGGVSPILAQKHYVEPSAVRLESLLREARRQKRIMSSSTCILDSDVNFGKGEVDGSCDRLQLIVIGDDRLRAWALP
jgi:hypothetical protein